MSDRYLILEIKQTHEWVASRPRLPYGRASQPPNNRSPDLPAFARPSVMCKRGGASAWAGAGRNACDERDVPREPAAAEHIAERTPANGRGRTGRGPSAALRSAVRDASGGRQAGGDHDVPGLCRAHSANERRRRRQATEIVRNDRRRDRRNGSATTATGIAVAATAATVAITAATVADE